MIFIGNEKFNFDDDNWRILDLPHDWSIEDLPASYKEQFQDKSTASTKTHLISGPFDSEAIGSYNSGYTVGGTAIM